MITHHMSGERCRNSRDLVTILICELGKMSNIA